MKEEAVMYKRAMRSKCFLLSFLFPLIVRAIPEIVSFPWPIGYDTAAYYAPFISGCQVYGLFAFLSLFSKHVAPFLYLLVGVVGVLSYADPLLVLKFFGPILSGFLGVSIFYFLTNYLGWGDKRSLVCVVLCVSYFVVLRITWDLFRNTLGLVFFFLAISQIGSLGKRRNDFLFVLFSLLCLFSHELVSILLFCVVVYLLLLELFPSFRVSSFLTCVKSYLDSKIKFSELSGEVADSELAEAESRKSGKLKTLNRPVRDGELTWYQGLFGTNLPPRVLSIYIFMVTFTVIIMLYYAGDFQFGFSSGLFSLSKASFLDDYISWSFGFLSYPSVDVLRGDIFSLFLICFTPILPFAVLGYFRNHPLDIVTLFLMVGSFMPVVFPHSALPLWYRWMLLLTFPLTIYACNFLLPDKQDSVLIGRLKISKRTRRAAFVVVVPALFLLSSAYMVLPPERAFPYFSIFNTQRYLPSSMQQNTLPFSQCPYVVLACEWLRWNMPLDSCLIAHESLYGWASLSLIFRPVYRYTFLTEGLSKALLRAGWYNTTYVLTLSPYDFFIRGGGFELVFRVGLIEVFKSVD